MNATDESEPRQIKDAPFCWQHKEALRMIRDVFEDGHGHSALAQSVYVALSELASDEQSETFTAPISQIARRAAVSYRTAANFLKRFEAINLIAVKRSTVHGTKEHAPSTYTMLGTPCLTLGKHFSKRLPRRLNNRNNRNKKHTHSAVFALNGLTEDQKQIIAHFNETFVPHGFLPVEKITKATRAILERKDCTLQRFDELLHEQATWPHKRTFYKLFHTPTAAERLTSKKSKDLQRLRSKLIADRNSGKLNDARMAETKQQLLAIKRILKTRGIEYPASL